MTHLSVRGLTDFIPVDDTPLYRTLRMTHLSAGYKVI